MRRKKGGYNSKREKALSWDIPVWVIGMKKRCFERAVIVFFDNMTTKMTTIFNSYGSF
jgi:hypothetical protein